MAKSDNPPFLFHIGTQKAGSTYLYNLLHSHPDITLNKLTEVDYFSRRFDKGLDWYLNSFSSGKNIIDISPKYFMLGKTVAPRIKEYAKKCLKDKNKKTLFLLILRNPIDYLYSHFQMHLRHNFFQEYPNKYPTVPKNIIEFIKKYPDYLERAYYFKILNEYWLPYFSLDHFKIIIFEEFIQRQRAILKEILLFWRLPAADLTSARVSKNKMLKHRHLLKAQAIVLKHKRLKGFLKSSRIFNFVYSRWLTEDSKNKLTKEERQYLQYIFQKDVKELKNLLGKKIVCWPDFLKGDIYK